VASAQAGDRDVACPPHDFCCSNGDARVNHFSGTVIGRADACDRFRRREALAALLRCVRHCLESAVPTPTTKPGKPARGSAHPRPTCRRPASNLVRRFGTAGLKRGLPTPVAARCGWHSPKSRSCRRPSRASRRRICVTCNTRRCQSPNRPTTGGRWTRRSKACTF